MSQLLISLSKKMASLSLDDRFSLTLINNLIDSPSRLGEKSASRFIA